MKKCSQQCHCCKNIPDSTSAGDSLTAFVLVGNMNVGKTTLFGRIRNKRAPSINIPGTTIAVKAGTIKKQLVTVYDTPGIHSIFSNNEDERASRDILLSPQVRDRTPGIILVADAKHLKRSIAIALQYAEYGLPMIFSINMIDEMAARGIEIDLLKLSELLGMEVHTTIAREGIGVDELIDKLHSLTPPLPSKIYPKKIEQFIDTVAQLLKPKIVSARALGLLILARDAGTLEYISANFGNGMLAQLTALADEFRQEENSPLEVNLSHHYYQSASKIVAEVQTTEPPSKNPFILTFGDWCTQLSTGIPIAFIILAMMYFFVGSFGATYLVDTINHTIFEGFLIPLTEKLVAPIPSAFFRDMIIDPDFGVLPTGVFLALGLVLPVIFCFYIAFGILEDSGYLPRISILLDQVFQKIGLNGKGVIPLVMGFSCVTMALLTTRILNTEKEKNIASFLLFLCMPCAPLIAVMFILLAKMPFSATVLVYGLSMIQILIAGYLANKILPGKRTPLLLEISPMRVPKMSSVLKMASRKTMFFMKEAIPVFVMASLVVFLFQRIGGLELLEKSIGPVIGEIMGLPEKSIQVFIKTMIRRESGAVELEHLSSIYTNLQIVVNLIVMVFIAPCINATIVLFKERGSKAGSIIMGTVILYAITIGSIVNHTCRFFGITFT